jgi:hypothetical protein
LTIGLASTSRPLVDAWGVLAGHQNAIPERESLIGIGRNGGVERGVPDCESQFDKCR